MHAHMDVNAGSTSLQLPAVDLDIRASDWPHTVPPLWLHSNLGKHTSLAAAGQQYSRARSTQTKARLDNSLVWIMYVIVQHNSTDKRTCRSVETNSVRFHGSSGVVQRVRVLCWLPLEATGIVQCAGTTVTEEAVVSDKLHVVPTMASLDTVHTYCIALSRVARLAPADIGILWWVYIRYMQNMVKFNWRGNFQLLWPLSSRVKLTKILFQWWFILQWKAFIILLHKTARTHKIYHKILFKIIL